MLVPIVIEKTHLGERSYDIYSRLLKDRIIMMSTPIDENVASVITAQLLFLESQEADGDVWMYINSPGGHITAGMAIFDTMNYIKCDISTVCVGHAASMGAFLLAAGTKGKRLAMPNAEIMIHQPMGAAQGQASDIEIAAEHIIKTKEKMNKLMSEMTGQDVKRIEADADRDNWMTATEAKSYGIIDKVINVRSK